MLFMFSIIFFMCLSPFEILHYSFDLVFSISFVMLSFPVGVLFCPLISFFNGNFVCNWTLIPLVFLKFERNLVSDSFSNFTKLLPLFSYTVLKSVANCCWDFWLCFSFHFYLDFLFPLSLFVPSKSWAHINFPFLQH